MCKCNRVAGIITTGVFSFLGWVAISAAFIILLADIKTHKERDIVMLALMFTARSVTIAIQIWFAAAQTREVLTMNYIAYISCMSVELVIMLLHVSLIASECGMRCGEGAVAFWYILFGVTGGLKLITNIVSAWNMMVYADEMQSKRLL